MAKFESWYKPGQFAGAAGEAGGLPDFRKRQREEAEFYAKYGSSPGKIQEVARLTETYDPKVLEGGQIPAIAPSTRPHGWWTDPVKGPHRDPGQPATTLTAQQQGAVKRFGDFRSLLESAMGPKAATPRAGEDEGKRLEAVLVMLAKKPFLSPQETAIRDAAWKKWTQLRGITIPEGLATEPEDGSTWWKPWTWGGKKTTPSGPGSGGGMPGLPGFED